MASRENNIYKFSDPKRPERPARSRAFRPSIKFLTAVALFMFVYMIFSFGTHFNKLYAMQQDVEKIQVQVKDLEKKNNELKQQLKMAQSDAYVEKVAREELNLAKPGESRIIPVQSNKKTDDQKTKTGTTGD
ncbi:cell division protein DivIC [Desulfocucumis palustris]|uniref:Cell division protein DivIC n=1 Tax=Desulfocucumis palustris TaxID=1898651 RepID=A0A2L2X7S4_9FIRM|nr:septum formation initiator family protein [Desulfocucumis palustris]GBF32148.1 cell division protein DivIC [Desulfocucumis palustris]